jgi:hypothetical protein
MKTITASTATLLLVIALFPGCSDDPNTPPPVFSVSPSSATVAPGGDVVIMMSGGTAPYSITAGTDASVATAAISSDTLTVHGVDGGYTTLTLSDAASATIVVEVVVTGAITDDLFPLTLGRKFTYSGYAITTAGATLPDPAGRYQTVWTVGPAGPLPFSTVIVDSTRLIHPIAGEITVARNLVIIKNPLNGEFFFLQTLGPFFRAFGIDRTDTVRAVSIAKPDLGIGGEWTALDSVYVDSLGANVRLQILGRVEGGEVVTDSSAAHAKYETIRFRTWRKITVNSAVIVDDATTSKIWLRKDLGPVQVLIAQDTENLGHFRVMNNKNF